jgi:thiol-disulfide isomerase/thioredoxin
LLQSYANRLLKALSPAALSLILIFAGFPPANAVNREVYPAPEQAKADLAAGLKAARAGHKHLILDFGGNWCGDCIVLDSFMHDPTNLPILEPNYVVVHINVGHFEFNQQLAARYQVQLTHGVPVLVVLDENGKLLFSQKTGVFESIRGVQSSSVTSFLVQWKPVKPGCSVVQMNC